MFLYRSRKSPSAVEQIFGGRKTPNPFDDDEPTDLMMTMKKPWAPPGSFKTKDDMKPQK